MACSEHTQIPCPDWSWPWQDHSSLDVYISEQKLSITTSKVPDAFFHQRSKWYWFLVLEGRGRWRHLRVCQTPTPKAYEIRCQSSWAWAEPGKCQWSVWRFGEKGLNLKAWDTWLICSPCRRVKGRRGSEEWQEKAGLTKEVLEKLKNIVTTIHHIKFQYCDTTCCYSQVWIHLKKGGCHGNHHNSESSYLGSGLCLDDLLEFRNKQTKHHEETLSSSLIIPTCGTWRSSAYLMKLMFVHESCSFGGCIHTVECTYCKLL